MDRERGIIRVRQQWKLAEIGPPGSDGKRRKQLDLLPVKTRAGNRDVPIPFTPDH